VCLAIPYCTITWHQSQVWAISIATYFNIPRISTWKPAPNYPIWNSNFNTINDYLVQNCMFKCFTFEPNNYFLLKMIPQNRRDRWRPVERRTVCEGALEEGTALCSGREEISGESWCYSLPVWYQHGSQPTDCLLPFYSLLSCNSPVQAAR